MKIAITSDSTCDLSKELIEKYDIKIIPLYINKGNESLRDGLEITPDDIFDYVDSGAGVCQTSALNIADYTDLFEERLKSYDAVIHFNISSGFSSCHTNAKLAAEDFENVYVIDTLKYLHKGGRCSGVAALGANLLKLKPCIEVVDGKMDVGKKYRGNFKTVILQYVRDRLSGRDDIDPRRIFITCTTGTPEDVIDAVEAEIKSIMQFDEIIRTKAGCTVSNHCGRVCLGILFFRK